MSASPTPPTGSSGSSAPQGSTKAVIVALVLAAATVILLNLYVQSIRQHVRRNVFTAYILRGSVQPGDRLRAKDVEAINVPDEPAFRRALRFALTDESGRKDNLMAVVDQDQPFERYANQGEFLMRELFTPPQSSEQMQEPRTGMRLKKLPVNSRTAPGGLRPGMHVDILGPFHAGGSLPSVLPVMENVEVKAVGRYTAADVTSGRRLSNYDTITLEVTPEQAQQLAMIEQLVAGEFEVVLRRRGDIDRPLIPGGGINEQVLRLVDQARRDRRPVRP